MHLLLTNSKTIQAHIEDTSDLNCRYIYKIKQIWELLPCFLLGVLGEVHAGEEVVTVVQLRVEAGGGGGLPVRGHGGGQCSRSLVLVLCGICERAISKPSLLIDTGVILRGFSLTYFGPRVSVTCKNCKNLPLAAGRVLM